MEDSEKLLEKIKNAPEKHRLTKKIYDAILIEPLYKDSWDSRYRDLNIYGAIKTPNGLSIEKIERFDVLKINSFFRKLKGFDITIDIPYLTSIIHIYFKNYQIEVEDGEFRFIEEREHLKNLRSKSRFKAVISAFLLILLISSAIAINSLMIMNINNPTVILTFIIICATIIIALMLSLVIKYLIKL